MTHLPIASRAAFLIIILIAFLSSILLAAEFDLVAAAEPVSSAGKRQGVELDELLTISGLFSALLAAVAWLNGRSAITDRRANQVLEHAAFLDPLTGISNRRRFNDRLASALARFRSADLPCAIVLIDLDRFKEVNDTLGHAAGDRLLVEVSDRIAAFAAVPEDAARLGGDEFAIILRGSAASESGARAALHRLESAIGKPVEIEGRVVQPGASVGLAFAGEQTSRASDLLEAADQDMYRAKRLRQRVLAA
jgi:diguanylate cyclase (GGDEF)-like protein